MSEPKKTIVINPDFLKLPMKGNKTRKNKDPAAAPKPIKIRSEKKAHSDKTIKRNALKTYIKKMQEEKYKRLINGLDDDGSSGHSVEMAQGKTYADEFKNSFDDSLAFLQKLTDQNAQKVQVQNTTLRQYPPVVQTNSTLFNGSVLDKLLSDNISLVEPEGIVDVVNIGTSVLPMNPIHLPKPLYGCLKGGKLPTYRTLKEQGRLPLVQSASNYLGQFPATTPNPNSNSNLNLNNYSAGSKIKLTPEQQRAELKQFLEKRKDEKQRVERVKRQRNLVKAGKKQKRTTTRTFRVGKSKHYPRVGVLIPNKTIRTQVLAKKQKIRETPVEDVRKYLIKKGLIRVGSSCPNDVLRQMYESSMMMCGEIQNHNPDNLLYNYLHNGL
jgi:hypothetical protein